MNKDNTSKNPLQKILEKACKGTAVTTRELITALSAYDLAAIREGEITAEDLKTIVSDIADDKENADRYRVEP